MAIPASSSTTQHTFMQVPSLPDSFAPLPMPALPETPNTEALAADSKRKNRNKRKAQEIAEDVEVIAQSTLAAAAAEESPPLVSQSAPLTNESVNKEKRRGRGRPPGTGHRQKAKETEIAHQVFSSSGQPGAKETAAAASAVAAAAPASAAGAAGALNIDQEELTRIKEEQAAGQRRIAIWNTKEKRKISGFTAPMLKNLAPYLAKNPHCGVYTPRRNALQLRQSEAAKLQDEAQRNGGGGGAQEAPEASAGATDVSSSSSSKRRRANPEPKEIVNLDAADVDNISSGDFAADNDLASAGSAAGGAAGAGPNLQTQQQRAARRQEKALQRQQQKAQLEQQVRQQAQRQHLQLLQQQQAQARLELARQQEAQVQLHQLLIQQRQQAQLQQQILQPQLTVQPQPPQALQQWQQFQALVILHQLLKSGGLVPQQQPQPLLPPAPNVLPGPIPLYARSPNPVPQPPPIPTHNLLRA